MILLWYSYDSLMILLWYSYDTIIIEQEMRSLKTKWVFVFTLQTCVFTFGYLLLQLKPLNQSMKHLNPKYQQTVVKFFLNVFCLRQICPPPPPKKKSPSFWPNLPLWLWEKFTCMDIDNVYNNACISICTLSIPCRMHTWFNHMCYLIILLPMTTNSKFWQSKESLNTKYGVPMSQTQNICFTLDKSLKHC